MSLNTVPIDFETSIGPWIGRTSKMVDYYLQEAFDRNGIDLTKEQMVVLKKLHDQDGINQNELASLTYRDKSSLARLLSKMELKNYIRREKSMEDKRNNEIFITTLGAKVFEDTRPVIKEIMDIMEDGLEDSDKTFMISRLKKIQFNFTRKDSTKLTAKI